MRPARLRRAAALGGLLVALLAAATEPAWSLAAADPTPAQVRHATTAATHSRWLWATVNVCARRKGGGGTIGVRGEMGALGFPATLTVTVALRRYDAATHRFVALAGATATHTTTLGTPSHGLHQGGAEFPFASAAGRLDATVTFTWTRAGHRLASVTEATTGGHHHVAYARPAGYSAADCTL